MDPEDDSMAKESDWENSLRFGWFFSDDSELVYNPQDGGCGPIIQDKEGNFEDRYIGRAQRKVAEGRGGLWMRLGPIVIDDIEIRQNTKIWHEERDTWLRASEIRVSEEPEPIIQFQVEGTWPTEYIEYYGSDLIELREEGIIESQREVNDRAAKALEEFREASQ